MPLSACGQRQSEDRGAASVVVADPEAVTIRAGRDPATILKRVRVARSDQPIEAKATLWCARDRDVQTPGAVAWRAR
jgi:hypothetical protein